jgi:hypothetical protein
MAKVAADGMTLRQREIAVLNVMSHPSGRTGFVALDTVCVVSGSLVIGSGCCQIIASVAIHALNSDWIKPPG